MLKIHYFSNGNEGSLSLKKTYEDQLNKEKKEMNHAQIKP